MDVIYQILAEILNTQAIKAWPKSLTKPAPPSPQKHGFNSKQFPNPLWSTCIDYSMPWLSVAWPKQPMTHGEPISSEKLLGSKMAYRIRISLFSFQSVQRNFLEATKPVCLANLIVLDRVPMFAWQRLCFSAVETRSQTKTETFFILNRISFATVL